MANHRVSRSAKTGTKFIRPATGGVVIKKTTKTPSGTKTTTYRYGKAK